MRVLKYGTLTLLACVALAGCTAPTRTSGDKSGDVRVASPHIPTRVLPDELTADQAMTFHRTLWPSGEPGPTESGWCVVLPSQGAIESIDPAGNDEARLYPQFTLASLPAGPRVKSIGSIWTPLLALSKAQASSGVYVSGTTPSVASDKDKTFVAASEGTAFVIARIDAGNVAEDWELFVIPVDEDQAKTPVLVQWNAGANRQAVRTGQFFYAKGDKTGIIGQPTTRQLTRRKFHDRPVPPTPTNNQRIRLLAQWFVSEFTHLKDDRTLRMH